MAGIELKRYTIRPDGWEGFLAVWKRIVVVRKRHGFRPLFALVDRKNNMFTWSVEHHGDYDAAAKAYYEDPERVELEIVGNYVTDHEITRVEQQPIP